MQNAVKPAGNHKSLIFLQLNELNFDLIDSYLSKYPGRFIGFEKLLKCERIYTDSEGEYEELEPWIQWASVHTGMSFREHGLYRLGDIVGSEVGQIFEKIESAGFTVGCISPMNAENRLKKAAYFLPDPWTVTVSDSSWWSRKLSSAISQAVNNNAEQKIKILNKLILVLALIRFIKLKFYPLLFRLMFLSFRAKWRKALVLDVLLHNVHASFYAAKKPSLSTLFLNAGAHIQHHYLFNCPFISKSSIFFNPKWYVSPKIDPILEMIEVYDILIKEYIKNDSYEILVATGLSQKPYDRLKYYYRIKDHSKFLNKIGINFLNVYPRMTRDFLITFSSQVEAIKAKDILAKLKILGKSEPLFGVIDLRESELFVSITYPDEIIASDAVYIDGEFKTLIFQDVVFVAIKNGMHQSKGFAFFTAGLMEFRPNEGAHIKELYHTICKYFAIPAA